MSAPLETDRSRWYLDEEEEMGEARLQRAIIALLLTCLQDFGAQQGWTDCVIDSDQFFSWDPTDPRVRVAPDIYLVRDPPADPWVVSWQTWRPGHNPPAFALEVVSQDWRKDYEIAAAKYAALGVEELVIFDPTPDSRPSGRGVPFQHYQRDRGVLRRRHTGKVGVFSRVLGAWIVMVQTPEGARLRLASPAVSDLLPTPVERLAVELAASLEREERERAEKEQVRAEKERERAEKERERAEKERLADRLRALGIDPDCDS